MHDEKYRDTMTMNLFSIYLTSDLHAGMKMNANGHTIITITIGI